MNLSCTSSEDAETLASQTCTLSSTVTHNQDYQYESGLASYPFGMAAGLDVDSEGTIYSPAMMRSSTGYQMGIRTLDSDNANYSTLIKNPAGSATNSYVGGLYVDSNDNVHILIQDGNSYYIKYDAEAQTFSAKDEIDDVGCTGFGFNYLYGDEASSLIIASGTNFSNKTHYVCRSTDGGASFTQVNSLQPTVGSHTLFYRPTRLDSGDFLIPGGFDNGGEWVMGLIKSSDNGATWSDPTLATGVVPYNLTSNGGYATTAGVHIFQDSESTVYLVGYATSAGGNRLGVILKSTDDGDTWSVAQNAIEYASGENLYLKNIVEDANGNLYIAGSSNDSGGTPSVVVYKSDDGFATYSIFAEYTSPNTTNTGLSVYGIQFDGAGNLHLSMNNKDSSNVDQIHHATLNCELDSSSN